jgi:hypothetical protein
VSTPIEEAKELMLVIATPSALVTGTFLAFAGRAIRENQAKVDRLRMAFALGASVAAVGLTAALTWLLTPLAIDHLWSYRGELEPILVVYWMILLSVAGTLVFSMWTVYRCVKELGRPAE